MRLKLSPLIVALLAVGACGGTPQRAAMPDVASTDQSADDMGLPTPSASETPDAAPTQALTDESQ